MCTGNIVFMNNDGIARAKLVEETEISKNIKVAREITVLL